MTINHVTSSTQWTAAPQLIVDAKAIAVPGKDTEPRRSLFFSQDYSYYPIDVESLFRHERIRIDIMSLKHHNCTVSCLRWTSVRHPFQVSFLGRWQGSVRFRFTEPFQPDSPGARQSGNGY